MSIIHGEILNTDIEKVINTLKTITIEEQPFIKPKGIVFLGHISEPSFKLITLDTPPAEVYFNVSRPIIKIEIRKDSLTATFTTLIYALGYPIAVALLIWGIIDKDVNLIGKLFLVGFLGFPFLLNLVVKHFYESIILKKDNDLLNEIEHHLCVTIIKRTQPGAIMQH